MVEDIGDIDGVGPATKHQLKEGGIESLDELADATLEDFEDISIGENKATRLMNKAKQNTVIIQTGDEVTQEYDSKEHISTGMDVLDEVLNGGWEEGYVIALPGEAGTGKTQVCFQSMVSAVEQTGAPAIYIETERGRYRDDRLDKLASEDNTQKDIYRVKAYDLDQQKQAYRKIRDAFDEVSLIVIDSFTARFRLSDKFEDRGSLSQRSTEMAKHLTELERMAEELEVPILITAQVYSNPGQYGKSEYVYGGSLFMHTVGYFLHMQPSSGKMVNATLRNHPGKEDTELSIRIGDEDLEAMREV